jgi:hypothetical protein
MTEREAQIYADYAEIIEELQHDIDDDYITSLCEMHEEQDSLKQAA